MIFLLCCLAAFGIGQCLDQLQTREEIEMSINRTIFEVERLIKIDSSLPQLSRAQIVDILHNITSKDMESLEKSIENSRLDYQRALTVVLPYNSRDAHNEDIQNLFTKPPMIQVIPDSETMLPYASIQQETPVSSDPIIENIISTKYPDDANNQFQNNKNVHKNHRKTYDEPAKIESTSQKYNLNLNNFYSPKTTWPTTSSILKLINSENNDNNNLTSKAKLEIVYSTSVTDKPTTRMINTTSSSFADEFKPTMPATKSTVNILTSDQWKYFAPPSATASTISTSTIASIITTSAIAEKPSSTTSRKLLKTTTKLLRPVPFRRKPQPFLPTVISTSSQWPTYPTREPFRKTPISTSKAPDMVTFDMSDMKIMSDESTPMLFVTPMPVISQVKISNVSSAFGSSDTEHHTVSTSSVPMRKGVATLLASIGLEPIEEKNFGSKYLNNEVNLNNKQEILATNFGIPIMNDTSHGKPPSLSEVRVNSSSIFNQSIFASAQQGVDNLSSDVQKLFQQFGIESSESEARSTTIKAPIRSSFKSDSWSNFKPLPRSVVKDASMKDFLAKFGLGMENRNSKSIKKSKEPLPSVIEAVPSAMKNILENIGLLIKPGVPRNVPIKIKTTTTTSTTEDPSKMHVFKPHEVVIADPQQRMMINELLDTVKLVQEGEADVSDVRKVADDLLKNTKTFKDGPNPLSLDELFSIYNDDVKNEVKRQESKANLINDTATITSDPTDSMVTVMINKTANDNSSKNTSDSVAESSVPADVSDGKSGARIISDATMKIINMESLSPTEDPNLVALADSFGGSTAEPDPVLPTPKKSGLYFLVDWNSFLEVGVEGEDKVKLKFAPKVGDRTRFIPVTVP